MTSNVAMAHDWPGLAETFRRAEQGGELDAYRRRRWGNDGRADWLDQDYLPSLTEIEASALYRGAGGRQAKQFGANPIEYVRDAVDFLLYDTIKLENRFDECATETGGFGLVGASKEWPSYLLTLREPMLFAPWSPHTERALRRLGMLPPGLRGGHPGLCYIDLLDTLAILANRLQLPDFRGVDEFCYLNGRQKRAAGETR
ncbi:MAG: hypothetical protein OXL37_02905 [Chloroflexota bacterium]|nr:hypothetical protein [Chloroflexota bacterium]MDE2961934.1 hypothetical protein [Chloroflexota bacterium]